MSLQRVERYTIEQQWYTQYGSKSQVYTGGSVHHSSRNTLIPLYTCPNAEHYKTQYKLANKKYYRCTPSVLLNSLTQLLKLRQYCPTRTYTIIPLLLYCPLRSHTIFKIQQKCTLKAYALFYSDAVVYTQAMNINAKNALMYTLTTQHFLECTFQRSAYQQ